MPGPTEISILLIGALLFGATVACFLIFLFDEPRKVPGKPAQRKARPRGVKVRRVPA